MPFGFPIPGAVERHIVAGGRAWQVVERHARGVHVSWWMELSATTMGADPAAASPVDWIALVERDRNPRLAHDDTAPSWGTFSRGGAPPTNAGADHAFGWPLPALWYRVNGAIGGNTATATGIEGAIRVTPPSTLQIRGYGFRALPLYPAWRGLPANTLLFATILWLAFAGLPSARRALRTRRERCPKCAYDLRGLAPGSRCPECGRGATA
jgi:hypothetical protein